MLGYDASHRATSSVSLDSKMSITRRVSMSIMIVPYRYLRFKAKSSMQIFVMAALSGMGSPFF
jgi:hypothetical protein